MTPNLLDQIIKTISKITKTFAFTYMQDKFPIVILVRILLFLFDKTMLCYSKVSLHYINSQSSCLLIAVNCTKHAHITFDIAKRPVKIYA